MEYYLGIDIGTTSAKAVAFSLTGEVITSCSSGYKMYHPQPNWSEQDPEEVFKATVLSCNTVVAYFNNIAPALVAFSSAMHCLMAMDKEGKPLTNCMIWADNRASEIAENLKDTEAGKSFYAISGVPIHAMSPFCKILWLKENDRAIFKKTFKFIGIKEYIYYRLFGDYFIDTSLASATGLLNLKTLCWDELILDFLHISAACLSSLVPVKHTVLFNQKSSSDKSLQIADDTPFVIGGSDGALANLGSGAIDSSSMAISIGTSAAARVVTNAVETDRLMRTFCYHLKDDLYIIGGPSNNGAVVLEWLKDILLETTDTFPALFQRAGTVGAGSDDLIFLPYILGERAPVWNSNATGVFFGLNINHTKSHLVRACMEGVIYAVFSIARLLLEKRVITRIYATGGFVQSDLWLQMLADVCGITVCVSVAGESSALGAVMIGMEALHIPPFAVMEGLQCYEPNFLNNKIYSEGFHKFERLYQLLRSELVIRSAGLQPRI